MKSKIAEILIAKGKPAMDDEMMMDDENEGMMDEGQEDGVAMAAADLIAAIKADDHMAVADALRAAFEIMESEPHVEGEHLGEEGEEEDEYEGEI